LQRKRNAVRTFKTYDTMAKKVKKLMMVNKAHNILKVDLIKKKSNKIPIKNLKLFQALTSEFKTGNTFCLKTPY